MNINNKIILFAIQNQNFIGEIKKYIEQIKNYTNFTGLDFIKILIIFIGIIVFSLGIQMKKSSDSQLGCIMTLIFGSIFIFAGLISL